MAKMTAAQRYETRWQRAAERARAEGLQFRRSESLLDFLVVSQRGQYVVHITSLSRLAATCECEGASKGWLCKHVAGVFMLIGLIDRDGNRVA